MKPLVSISISIVTRCCVLRDVGKFEAEGVAGLSLGDDSVSKKRCAWVTSNTDLLYALFHDQEWGVPVHEDKRLFELIILCTALAELNWPSILGRRETFREIFQDFDPVAVSKLNEKKIIAPGSPASILLSELRLRAIIENARQTCKIIEEHGCFDNYIWSLICELQAYSWSLSLSTSGPNKNIKS